MTKRGSHIITLAERVNVVKDMKRRVFSEDCIDLAKLEVGHCALSIEFYDYDSVDLQATLEHLERAQRGIRHELSSCIRLYSQHGEYMTDLKDGMFFIRDLGETLNRFTELERKGELNNYIKRRINKYMQSLRG